MTGKTPEALDVWSPSDISSRQIPWTWCSKSFQSLNASYMQGVRNLDQARRDCRDESNMRIVIYAIQHTILSSRMRNDLISDMVPPASALTLLRELWRQ